MSQSAQRFAARIRARRRRQLMTALAVLVVLLAGAWGALGASWATVQHVEVTGTHRLNAGLIRAAGEREAGQPLLLARVSQVRAEVAAQRLVRAVTVTRHWPSTLRIRVTERVPVAAVPLDAGRTDNSIGKSTDPPPASSTGTTGASRSTGTTAPARMRLVDTDGVTVTTTSRVPAGLPVLNVDPGTTRGVAALTACLSVLRGLPPPIRAQVRAIGAVSPDGVWLRLASGARVQWGGADQGALKARVLSALLKQKAVSYDLRAPDSPAVHP